MFDTDCVIVGAGVVGLAIAREMAMAGHECIVLEAGTVIGNVTSSRNSEVIHAGIYYPKDSLKAIACVEGKHRLYDYLREHHVPHKNITKLIVATSDAEVGTLDEIRAKAAANGVDDLEFLTPDEVTKLEPAIRCKAALISPSTGIVDSHAYMLSLQGEAEDHGAMLALSTRFIKASSIDGGFCVTADSAGETTSLNCRLLINSGGLDSQDIAGAVDALAAESIPERLIVKGNYFTLAGKSPFSRLIYPVPEKHGLGVHVTIDMGGAARFGPDTELIDEINYDVDPKRSEVFYDAVRRYWPQIEDGSLTPAYSGIRPKVQTEAADFMIMGPADHGVTGLVNCFGIESPGLTASLYLAERVRESLTA